VHQVASPVDVGDVSRVRVALPVGGVLLLTGWALGACSSTGSTVTVVTPTTTSLPAISPVPDEARRAASSALMAITPDDRWVYVVNSDTGSVTAIDTLTDTAVWELPIGVEPRSMALDPRGRLAYVSDFAAGSVTVVDLEMAAPVASFTTDRHPYGVLPGPDGQVLFVAESGADAIALFDSGTYQRLGTIAVEPNPRGLAVSANGERLYVTHFMSGHVSVIDVSSREVLDVIGTGAESVAAQFIAIAPGGEKAYLPHSRSRVSNPHLQFDSTIAPLVSVIDLGMGTLLRTEVLGLDAIDRPVNMPFAVAFSPEGRLLYVVNSGSNDLSVVDLESALGVGHVSLGDNPRGIVVTSDGDRAYVLNALSNDVSILDLEGLAELRRISVADTALPPDVQRGKVLFFSSDRPELARDQWVSCASCHLEGGHDGRTWPFADGPRNTPAIRGLADSAPFHWSGDRVDLLDFQDTITGVQGGTGITTNELSDLAAFLGFGGFEASPYRLLDGSLSSAAEDGLQVFGAAGCGSCHSGDAFTDRRLHDVGTALDPRETRGREFDTPSLLGIYDTAPYLHDGSSATLWAVITTGNLGDRHGVTSTLSEEQIDSLIAYLQSLP